MLSPGSAPDPSLKSINITGPAATHMAGGAKTRRRRHSTKQQGGMANPASDAASSTAPSAQIVAPTMNVIRQMGSAAPTAGPAPAPTLAPPSAQTGGSTPGLSKQKISLLPAKLKNKTRVLLTPKGQQQQSTANKQVAGPHKPTSQTRRHKKLSIRVSAVRRKIASTRKHIHASTSMPIDKIRKELVDAKLLNPASKAPEALIRKIYADYKITTAK